MVCKKSKHLSTPITSVKSSIFLLSYGIPCISHFLTMPEHPLILATFSCSLLRSRLFSLEMGVYNMREEI